MRQFDLFQDGVQAGKLEAVKGAGRAEEKANDTFDFTLSAIKAVMDFPFNEFTIPAVRDWAEQERAFPKNGKAGFDSRAWGAIPLRMVKFQLIEKVGMANSHLTPGHAHPISLWRKTGKTFDINAFKAGR